MLRQGLADIGTEWYENRVSVQQEHFTAELALRQVESLLTSTYPATRDGRILIACPPEEQHTFSVLLLTLLFRRQGWHVVYLGANVPTEQMESAVNEIQPDFVILSAQTLFTAGKMLSMTDMLNQAQLLNGYGGNVFQPDRSCAPIYPQLLPRS